MHAYIHIRNVSLIYCCHPRLALVPLVAQVETKATALVALLLVDLLFFEVCSCLLTALTSNLTALNPPSRLDSLIVLCVFKALKKWSQVSRVSEGFRGETAFHPKRYDHHADMDTQADNHTHTKLTLSEDGLP